MTERSQTPTQAPSGGPVRAGAPDVERRRNPRLRELVDEMLASVRVAARRDLWTEEERKQYEAELADIMRRVRFEAVWKQEAANDQPAAGGPTARAAGAADGDAG